MTSFEAMVAEAKAAADRRASLVPLAHLKEASRLVPGAISALSSLRTDDRAVTVIAEVKRSTATFADLSGVGDPGMLACFYAAGGAACVSVVTGPSATRGSLKDLDAVRASVELPVLASDLVVTPYQVHEARAHGADLLMLDARLETLVLEGLIERVHSLGMGAVVEVRTRFGTKPDAQFLSIGADKLDVLLVSLQLTLRDEKCTAHVLRFHLFQDFQQRLFL